LLPKTYNSIHNHRLVQIPYVLFEMLRKGYLPRFSPREMTQITLFNEIVIDVNTINFRVDRFREDVTTLEYDMTSFRVQTNENT